MGIFIALFLLSVLVLWLLIGARGHWSIKTLATALALYTCVSAGTSLTELAGWPTKDETPARFRIHWIEVREPNKRTQAEGAIYIWVTELNLRGDDELLITDQGYFALAKSYLLDLVSNDEKAPRAYQLPYSLPSHKKANGILSDLKEGKPIMGINQKKIKAAGDDEGDGDSDGKNGKGKGGKGKEGQGKGKEGKKGGHGGFSLSDDIFVGPLPPPSLPDKDGNE